MAGGGSSSTRLQIRPETEQQIQSTVAGLQSDIQGFKPQAQQAAGNIQTGFGFAPTLQQSQQPQFPTGLDALSQRLVSQGAQGLQQQAATQQRQIGRQLSSQPGVAKALQAQAAMRSRLQANPLLFQAAQQQSQRQLAQQQLGLQTTESVNRALLAEAQERSRQQQLGNQAITQQFGLQTSPIQAQTNLLSSLGSVAGLTGTQRTTQGK